MAEPGAPDTASRPRIVVSNCGICGVRSPVPGNVYQSGWSGTSMATPHVAASVALLWQAKPSLKGDIDTTQRLLQQNTVPGHYVSIVSCGITPGNRPNNVFGWGLLNILSAVQAH